MPQAINLVVTRCTDSNHAALQRWYNDHAQLLMASQELQSAELFHLAQSPVQMDYFCLYHFAQLSAFEAFDRGEVMTQVRDLSNAAAGRSSIEVVQRTQYERMLNRSWPVQVSEPGSAKHTHFQASLFCVPSAAWSETTRWLNDVFYQLHVHQGLLSAQAYAHDAGQHLEFFVLLQACHAHALPHDWQMQESAYAARPSIRARWQSLALPVAAWRR